METETQKLQRQIDELNNKIKQLTNSTSIPLDIDSAFRKRFNISEIAKKELSISSKGATSENKTVDEAGTATYSVLKAPDGFLQVPIGTTIYYLPYFT